MSHEQFIEKAKAIVMDYENYGKSPKEYKMTQYKDVFVVWSCKTLQNSKAILSTKLPGAPLFEITRNGDKGEIYIDVYQKISNECIKA
jgi:hypothetical protein